MKKKWMAAGIVAISLLLTAVGIAVGYLFSFPAEEYGMAFMDAVYREQFDDYGQLTGADPQDMKQAYRQGIQRQAQALKSYFGVTELSEKGEEQLEEFVRMLYNYVEYDVVNADEENRNWKITLKVQPIAFYQMIDEKQAAEEFRKKTENGEYLELDEAAYQDAYVAFLIKQYKDACKEDIPYEEPKEYCLTLNRAGSTYIPDEEESAGLQRAGIAFSK